MIKLKSLFRRGPSGPSSSKQAAAAAAASSASANAPAPPLKGASSVSSLDHHHQQQPADGKPSKAQKHGSKDRLTSREKLCSSRESLDLKEAASKRQQQQPPPQHRQMPLVQQQLPPPQPLQHLQHHHLGGNNNLPDGSASAGGYAAMVVDPALTKELTDISFDGPREVSVVFRVSGRPTIGRRWRARARGHETRIVTGMVFAHGGVHTRCIDRLVIIAVPRCMWVIGGACRSGFFGWCVW